MKPVEFGVYYLVIERFDIYFTIPVAKDVFFDYLTDLAKVTDVFVADYVCEGNSDHITRRYYLKPTSDPADNIIIGQYSYYASSLPEVDP